jgi:hypothetical protein
LALRPRRQLFRRGVGLVLLLLVTSNVTAEFVHHHARALPARTDRTASAGDTSTGETTARPLTSGVCLLCQFQQQLAHGLMQVPPFALRPLSRTAAVVLTDSYELPTIRALPRGRAPPLASLL